MTQIGRNKQVHQWCINQESILRFEIFKGILQNFTTHKCLSWDLCKFNWLQLKKAQLSSVKKLPLKINIKLLQIAEILSGNKCVHWFCRICLFCKFASSVNAAAVIGVRRRSRRKPGIQSLFGKNMFSMQVLHLTIIWSLIRICTNLTITMLVMNNILG